MNTANIDRKFIIDEDPKIIVTGKTESLATLKCEAGMDFIGEMKIVTAALITAEFTINGKEGAVQVREDVRTASYRIVQASRMRSFANVVCCIVVSVTEARTVSSVGNLAGRFGGAYWVVVGSKR